MSKNKPRSLPTGRHRHNAIFAGFVAALILGASAYALMDKVLHKDSLIDAQVQENTPVVVQEVQEQVEYTNENTPEKAREVLAGYYNGLASRNAEGLRSIGALDAAYAAERQWLDAIGYAVDFTKTMPDINEFPQPVGLYAGCTLYNIADFYTSYAPDSIRNDVTGTSGVQGWIYYNPIDAKWIIVDPTIPTAIATPQSANVERPSEDRTFYTKMGCAGAFANPWWCYARIDVSLSNNSPDKDAIVTPAVFDSGMNVIVPEELQGVCQRATVAEEGAGESLQVHSTPTSKSGACIIYRGIINGFGIDRIGAQPQSFDGNISPVVIEFGEEDVSPIFAIGRSTTEGIQDLITQSDIEQYNITNEAVDIDPNYPTVFEDQQALEAQSETPAVEAQQEGGVL